MNAILDLGKFSLQKMHYYTALLYAFSIALHQKLATITLILWVVFSAVNYATKALNTNKLLLALPLLYMTYIGATLYAGADSYSFLEHKLSFLVFPLIFFLHKYNGQERRQILKWFIYGLLFAISICFMLAFYRSLTLGDNGLQFVPNVLEGKGFFESIIYGGNYFFGNHFSLFHQTVYFGLYLCSAIAILLLNDRIFDLRIRVTIITIFVLVLFLLSNKAAFLALAILFVFKIFTLKIPFSKKAFILISLLIAGLLFAFFNPRIKGSIQKLTTMEIGIDKDARYDFSIRILSWDAAVELIREKPVLGYGAGNTQEQFNKMYKQKGYAFPLKEKLNAHNQFFQSWIENGIVGVLFLTCLFVLLFKAALNSGYDKYTFIVLIIIILLNALFESVFNRFSGVSFIAFIVCFILTGTIEKGGRNEI